MTKVASKFADRFRYGDPYSGMTKVIALLTFE